MPAPFHIGSIMTDRRYLPVAPADGLFVLRLGHCDDVRFARLFAEAWRMIPPEDREAIVSTRWTPLREHLSETCPGQRAVAPLLMAVSNGRSPDCDGVTPWAGTLDNRISVWDAAAITAAPDEIVRAAVGYELAEVALWPDYVWRRDESSRGWVSEAPVWYGHDGSAEDAAKANSFMFDAVWSLAEGWGFDPMSALVWTKDQGDRFTRAA